MDHEQHWIETMDTVSEWVWQSMIHSFTSHSEIHDVFSELTTADQDTHLEAAISILDTMEGVASMRHCASMYCDGLFRVYTASHRGCSQEEA